MINEISEIGKKTIEELKNIKNLPTIPKVVLEVNEMLRNHNSNIARLTEVIGRDQGLTTKILAVANSPMYGLPRNVASLEFAIMLLGMKEISNIVTALSLAQVIKTVDIEGFNYQEFWLHSMIVGTASKDIAKRLGYPELAGDAFVAGMLHDIGIQLIASFFPNQFQKIIMLTKDKNKRFYDAEIEILGVTHEDIGHFLVSKWNLPSNLAEVLGYHHNPKKLGKKNVTLNIVYLADSMTRIFDIGNFIWDASVEYGENILDCIDLIDQAQLEKFIEEYYEVFKDTAEEMGAL
ncbi:MAG: HDOD domain-containing protein [Bacteroidetes bacterium]|nr:HDOD domain-containing protein [Bacteroidota bacterium]MBU1116707.1 HDOD domain-containing protein [Bacteroidota bacterium]MBU1799823.1 HDOD domain-containing protein [Bacteroidota bacterium]